jgi:Fur family zinc uptake transcriptional regulator
MSDVISRHAFPAPEHDHDHCLSAAMARALKAFEARGSKLTPLRRRVFREIAGSHRAVGAYDVLNRLVRKGTRLTPNSVYRVIDALIEAGVVHRLESRNAYFACHATHGLRQRQVVLACERCGLVAEVEAERVFAAIDKATQASAFVTLGAVVEVTGHCANCAAALRS